MRPKTPSALTADPVSAAETASGAALSADGRSPRTFLFTTSTCPNCHAAAASLEKAHIPYEVIDAEKNWDLVQKYGVMQAPTLILVRDGQVTKLANASNIKAYAERKV
ncbi:MAG TPA: thioredoxin family protein [Candidatus Mediterraneibacter vanvlietii]|nr:thioredoxin family protein [Candidatus Mediterraneibacter vanvlietii]